MLLTVAPERPDGHIFDKHWAARHDVDPHRNTVPMTAILAPR
jgi:hypothetical protein